MAHHPHAWLSSDCTQNYLTSSISLTRHSFEKNGSVGL
jgi:hypothetical protein